jgi:hypothetical protein
MPRSAAQSFIALGLIVSPGARPSAADVYKSFDAEGHVVYSDAPDTATSQSSMVPVATESGPPQLLHFCWTNCFTLSLDQGLYKRADGSDETWTVERFTSNAVILHRHDAPVAWNEFSTDVVYRGQVVNDRLIDVTVNGRPVPEIAVAWGEALDTLPGSNAERDDRQGTAAGELRAAAAPPPVPDDEQPLYVSDGDLWTPGYWGWDGGGYYWVPGAWVRPPQVGVLWTPGYWGYAGAVFVFHRGYWGPHVGYYGGVDYGYGYAGRGFTGGRWVGNSFIHQAVAAQSVHRVSYNGGPGGTSAVATAEERAAAAEPHFPPTPLQRQHWQQSASTRATEAHADERPALVAVIHTLPVLKPATGVATHSGAAPAREVSVGAVPVPAAGTSARAEPPRVAEVRTNPRATVQRASTRAAAPKSLSGPSTRSPPHSKTQP